MHLFALFCILTIVLIFCGSLNGEEAIGKENNDVVKLVNGIIDGSLKWAKASTLSKYDPWLLPTINQDDLGTPYSIQISEMKVKGLLNIRRLTDAEIQLNDFGSSAANPDGYFSMQIMLQLTDVHAQFRLKVTFLQFKVQTTKQAFNITLSSIITPSLMKLELVSLAVDDFDHISLTLQSQTKATTTVSSIPFMEQEIKERIKSGIVEYLRKGVQDAKEYVNIMLTSAIQPTTVPPKTLEPTSSSGQSESGDASLSRGVISSPLTPRDILQLTPTKNFVRGTHGYLGVTANFGSKIIKFLPGPGENLDSGGMQQSYFVLYDPVREEFVINKEGLNFTYKNQDPNNPHYPLLFTKEKDKLLIYPSDGGNRRIILLETGL